MLTRRQQFDADLEEEMRLHLELREQDQIQAGLSPREVRTDDEKMALDESRRARPHAIVCHGQVQ